MLTRRQLLLGGFAAVGGGAVVLPAWALHEADSLQFERVPVQVRGLDRPLKVAQLSDIHWDHANVPWRSIERAVEMVNALDVDLVALTGDFVTHHPQPIHELAPVLGALRSRHGSFAVLGNHDNVRYDSRRKIKKALERSGIAVLENRWTRVGELAVGGTGDLWFGPYDPARVLTPLRGRTPTLLLSHNPDTFWRLGDFRIDLQLSGHTHGGQVRLPGLGPVLALNNRLSRKVKDYLPELAAAWPYKGWVIKSNAWAGLYQQADNQLYVSRGMGRFKRLSIGCPPEVTLIELSPAA
ncbi:metallophosphoesterase [Gloeobacter violaceus]|uniref:Glr3608 protein n=1 Tax=Gloeobacter violaceus (strain ATCC 29082 / PCC 7421) TaxID=251221 RepID=Q7NFB8_GLOVI|nr:metallophosphoesterase [Gloeobacter violaceus]BAC91549.1 glr3608 [Gloeobacter violaceus PCC 7421]